MNRRNFFGAGFLAFLFGLFFPKKSVASDDVYDPKKSYTYDWHNGVTDDPRFFQAGKKDRFPSWQFPVIGENFSVTVNGKEIEHPGSIEFMKTGENGIVVLVPLGKELGYELLGSFFREIPDTENWYPNYGKLRFIKDRNHGEILSISAVLCGRVEASGWEFPK